MARWPWRANAGAGASGSGSTAWPLSVVHIRFDLKSSARGRHGVALWHGTVARAWQVWPGVCFLAAAAAAVLLRRGGVGYSASTDSHGSTWL